MTSDTDDRAKEGTSDSREGAKDNSGPTEGTVRTPEVDVSKDADHFDVDNIDVTEVSAKGDEDAKDADTATAEPELDEPKDTEAKDRAKEVNDRYAPDARKSVVLPGTDGTVSGTSIADWLDDDGNILDPENRPNAAHPEQDGEEKDGAEKDGDKDEKTEEQQLEH